MQGFSGSSCLRRESMNTVLTLFGGYGLKRGNLLLHFATFAFWALELILFVFRNCYN